MHRVQKLLSNYGYCSRRKAEELIKEGRVKVNGKTISIGDKAEETDDIHVDNKLVNKEERVYLMLNKPMHYVTALNDKYHKPVIELINIKKRIFPIGRLDYNTTGMLLFTNDGDFANKIMHPSNEIKKTYLVELNKPINEHEIEKIEKGVVIEGRKTSPAKVKSISSTTLEISIHEGRNRIIRRILEKLHFKARALKRIRIGKLELGNLEEGKYKFLTKEDKKMIFS